MKKIYFTIIMLAAFGSIACKSNTNQQDKQVTPVEKTDGEKFAEAYQNMDWETVVAIGDTLIDHNDTMNLAIAYAEALAATGNPQKALSILDKKLESNPDDYYLYQTKGNVYCAMEKYDSALICYDKVIEMKPSNARPYINEGAIYELRGDNERAIANYLVAAKLFASHNYHQEANEFASRVLNLDSTNVEAKEILGIE